LSSSSPSYSSTASPRLVKFCSELWKQLFTSFFAHFPCVISNNNTVHITSPLKWISNCQQVFLNVFYSTNTVNWHLFTKQDFIHYTEERPLKYFKCELYLTYVHFDQDKIYFKCNFQCL
jgi:hypothetical protein